MAVREGLPRKYEECRICSATFENTDGLGTCCSNKCWSVYEERSVDETKE
ncbi:hypothetical protein [Alkalihalobacillus sp. BA299]|nr:hypothetical protein [Alkalihalobacillus sp. BA299]